MLNVGIERKQLVRSESRKGNPSIFSSSNVGVSHIKYFYCHTKAYQCNDLPFFNRSFPHPHFDKPIPDPTDMPPGNKNLTQFLHLKKSFHDAIRDPAYTWEFLPICQSLLKLRLENTKVKGKILN